MLQSKILLRLPVLSQEGKKNCLISLDCVVNNEQDRSESIKKLPLCRITESINTNTWQSTCEAFFFGLCVGEEKKANEALNLMGKTSQRQILMLWLKDMQTVFVTLLISPSFSGIEKVCSLAMDVNSISVRRLSVSANESVTTWTFFVCARA